MIFWDLACYKLIWTTACCGHDCGKLRDPSDPWHAYNAKSFSLPSAPQYQYPPGYHAVLMQLGTKTYQGRQVLLLLWTQF